MMMLPALVVLLGDIIMNITVSLFWWW